MRFHFSGMALAALLSAAPSAVWASRAITTNADAFNAVAGASPDGQMEAYRTAIHLAPVRDPSADAPALNWRQAARMALASNPGLVEARLYVRQGQEQVTIGDAGFWPTLTAGAGINRGHGEQIFQGGVINTTSGSYEGDLTGSWNLFNGFATLATHEQNVAEVRNRQAAYDQASSALYQSLGQAFDQVLYDQAALALEQELVARYRSDTLYQEQEFKGGLTALWTYEKAQSDEAGQIWSYHQQRYALLSDRAALAVLLGRRGDGTDSVSAAGSLTVSAVPDDFRADLNRMVRINPTLAYYRTLAEAADAAVWLADSTRYPSVTATGSYGASGLETWGPRNRLWQASLNVSYELFAGGALEAAITQADLARRQAYVTVDDQKRQLQAALFKAWTALGTAWERLPSAQMAIQAGADRFATVGALYQSGREEFLDYEQAESIYSGSQTAALSALLAAAQAQVSYRGAVGLTLERAADDEAP